MGVPVLPPESWKKATSFAGVGAKETDGEPPSSPSPNQRVSPHFPPSPSSSTSSAPMAVSSSLSRPLLANSGWASEPIKRRGVICSA
ncbi:hypothetical protein D3C78_1332610 [compost metagenome]